MTAACLINDYVYDRRTFLLFSPDEFQRVNNVWQDRDRLLVELQSNPLFKGRERWCDLKPHHYSFLVTKNLAYVAQLPAAEQANEHNLEVKSLHFLLMAMIRCIEERARSNLEMMYVNRITNLEVAFNYLASINMIIEGAKVPDERGDIRVIIDNTKDVL